MTHDPASKRQQHILWFAGTAAVIVLLACLGTDWTGSVPRDEADGSSSSPSPTPSNKLGEPYATGTVSEVVNGDTIHVKDNDDKTLKVRLMGIDAPEVSTQCWGKQAAKFATDTLNDEHVTLYTDSGENEADGLERLLAYVVLDDDTNYSIAAIEAGAARAYDKGQSVKLADEFAQAASDAEDENAGLWGKPCDGNTKIPEDKPSTPDEEPETQAPTTAEDDDDDGDDPGSVYYPNCAAVRAAGAAPLHKGEPGYRSALDRDGDGIACDT